MAQSHPAGNGLPPQLVVRADPARYRPRWAANGVLAIGLVALAVFALVRDDLEPATRAGLLIASTMCLPVVIAAWRWQARTWLDPEPPLVLQPGQFRIRHKGDYVWVPWTDVADLKVAASGAGFGRVPALVFELAPGATTVLPSRTASWGDRFFALHPDKLTYSRPSDEPPFETVAIAAGNYFLASRQGASR